MKLNYNDANAPENYKCGKCGAHGVQLMRKYQTTADQADLTCRDCIAKERGARVQVLLDDQLSDWWVAAVPTPEVDTFWGFTSVPMEAVWWFRFLPAYKNQPADERKRLLERRVAQEISSAEWMIARAVERSNGQEEAKWREILERYQAIAPRIRALDGGPVALDVGARITSEDDCPAVITQDEVTGAGVVGVTFE